MVFDNLDRVTHEKAVEILATIKTFLETENVKDKGVVFLIPCDDRAIKEHLRNVYKLSDGDREAFSEEEFLRKFFNTTLRIPDFYPTELESYAMNLLNQTNIPELKESSVAWLVTKAYRQNPRQIKQFINQLIGMYILAKKRIESSSLPSDFLSGNIAKLAKFLVLYSKFPKQMEQLRQERIWSLEQVVNQKSGDENFTELNKFLKETEQISIDNLNIFLTLRRSEFEVELPGYDEFAIALQDNRVDAAISYMKAIPEFSKKKASLSQAVKKLLDETSLPDTKISIINSCLAALQSINERLENMVYVEMANELSNLKQLWHVIEPKVIFDQLLKHFSDYRDDFAQTYVSLLEQEKDKAIPPKFVEALFTEIIQNQAWFTQYISKLSNIITEKYYDQPQIIQLLLQNDQTQKTFEVWKILQKTISTLSPADLETGKLFNEKINLILQTVPDVLTKELINLTMKRLYEIFTNENTKPFDHSRIEINKRLLKSVALLLKKHLSSFSERSEQVSTLLCQVILTGMNRIGDWGQRNIYIEPLIFFSVIRNSCSGQAITTVREFISNAPFKDLIAAFEDRDEKEWNTLLSDSNYGEHFKQRALREQQIFDHLYTYLSEPQKKDWILALLDVDPMRGIQKIESLDFKIPDEEDVLRKLLAISEKVDINNRFKVYEICDKLKFVGSDELLQKACEDIKKYLTMMDEASQKLGYEISVNVKSFKDTRKRDIARKTIEWLNSLQPTQKHQTFAIRAVLHFWETLKEEHTTMRDFTEYIFKLLLDSKDINAVKQGIEVLKVIHPKHDEYETFYVDLRARIDKEQDTTLKEIYTQGLKELKIIDKNIE